MSAKSPNSEIVLKYLSKYRDFPSRTLAKVIYKDHPKLFKNSEHAGATIRYYRGASGKAKAKKLATKEFVVKHDSLNPFKLPKSYAKDFTPYIIKGENVGILSDVHIPYHNLEALSAAILHLKKSNIDTLLLNGDIWDCYFCSSFDKDPENRSTENEINDVNEFLDILQKQFPKCKIIYKEGNHENRWPRYLMRNVPEIARMHGLSIPSIFSLNERGIDYVCDNRIIKAGNLSIAHGHEFRNGISQPVNVARGLQLRANDNALQGHSHRTSEHIIRTINDKTIGAWSCGCLSELHPQYMPINNWNHGFCIVRVKKKDGSFEVENKKIINGIVY